MNVFSFLFLVSPLGDRRQPTRHLLRVANNIHTIRAAVDGSETRGTPTHILYIRVKLASSHADNHLFHPTMPRRVSIGPVVLWVLGPPPIVGRSHRVGHRSLGRSVSDSRWRPGCAQAPPMVYRIRTQPHFLSYTTLMLTSILTGIRFARKIDWKGENVQC